MLPAESDPNNHVPEVSPEDVWGDAGEHAGPGPGPGTVLPPRRPPPPEATGGAAGNPGEGLRINPNPDRLQSEEGPILLEVQEIDGHVVRLDPEEPTQARMPRHEVVHEKPALKPRELEIVEWGGTRKFQLRWILGVCLGIGSLVVVSISMLPALNRTNAATSQSGQATPAAVPEEVLEGNQMIEELLLRQPEAIQIFKSFASAAVTEDVLRQVRDRESVAPLIHKTPRKPGVSKSWSPGSDVRWNVMPNHGRPYGLLEGGLPDFSEFRAYFVMDDHQIHLDWKATTAYGSATFAELAEGRGDSSEIRAMIVPAGYYGPIFPEEEYRSYQLIAPDNVNAIWCYTRRGDEADEAVARLFLGGDIMKPDLEPQRVALRLEHGPVGAYPNQWLVGGMLHGEWISP